MQYADNKLSIASTLNRPALPLFHLIFSFLLVSALHAAPPKEALLIANGKYSHFAGLAHPLSDAAKLGAALEQLGFRVHVVRDGNREQMIDAISEFERGLRNTGAIAFFHYGGHGVQVDGKNYLLPADADIPDERRVATRAVALDEVMTAMDAAAARASIIVIDACRDNPLPAGSGRNLARGLSVVGMKPKNSIVIYAAEAGSKALDGLFTPILAVALQQKGRTIDQIMKSVRSEVYAKSNGQQTPGEYNQLFEELFLGEAAGGDLSAEKVFAATPAPSPIAAPPPAPSVEKNMVEASIEIIRRMVEDSDRSYRIGDYDVGLAKIQEAYKLLPDDPGIMLRIGRLLEKKGDKLAAAQTYTKVLEIADLSTEIRDQTRGKLGMLNLQEETTLASLKIIETHLSDLPKGAKTLRISTKPRSDQKIDPRKMQLHVFIYERERNGQIQLTKSQVVTEWISPPIDWSNNEPERLNAIYKPVANSKSSYAGYVTGVYYEGILQDLRADPEALAGEHPLPLSLAR